VNAFIGAAQDQAKTLMFVETENGVSICGGYLDVPWVAGGINDPGRKSFIFTLKNHLGVPPTKFAQRREDCVAFMGRGEYVYFGAGEGFGVWDGY
jgi:hypothetical protein